MRFCAVTVGTPIYIFRGDPDLAIFDRELDEPILGRFDEYNCTGVFEVQDWGEHEYLHETFRGACWFVCNTDPEYQLTAQAVLTGEFTDPHRGHLTKRKKSYAKAHSLLRSSRLVVS